MKVFKGLSLTDQKIMFNNLFVWDYENGDIPNREDYKKWILAFFESPVHINDYISDLEFDIELNEGDAFFYDLDESYRRQIDFLKQLKQKEMKTIFENTVWKVELINPTEIKIHGEYKTNSMYIVLSNNTYIYYGANYILPKYISKIIAKYLPIK